MAPSNATIIIFVTLLYIDVPMSVMFTGMLSSTNQFGSHVNLPEKSNEFFQCFPGIRLVFNFAGTDISHKQSKTFLVCNVFM